MTLLKRIKALETRWEHSRRPPTPDEIAARVASIMSKPPQTPLHKRIHMLLGSALRRKTRE